MTEREFAQLRPWMDGFVTDAGYLPPRALIRKGWLRHEFDGFYRITESGMRAVEQMRGVPAAAVGECPCEGGDGCVCQ